MSYVCCDQCNYQCRVAANLLGRQVRCPKCRHVVLVTAELTISIQPGKNSTNAGSDPAAELYIGNIMKRRGPVLASQLELLARWQMIGANELLSDESGSRQSTVHEFLEAGGWPAPPEVPRKVTPPKRPSRFGRILPEKKPVKPPILKPETSRDPNLTHEQFMSLIDRAVQMERTARSVEIERTECSVDIYIPGPAARFVRTTKFAQSYNLIAFVYMVNALVSCIFFTSTMGMFVKRLLQLSVSVFIPFGHGGEQIEGEPLMQCGLALVFVLGQFVLPIWWLVRQDCVIWHCLGGTFLGLFLGMAMKPEWLWVGFQGIRAAAVLSGFALSGLAWQLSCHEHSDRVNGRLRVAAVMTAFFAIGMTTVDMKSLFVADMTGLSPTVSGNGLQIAVFASCFFGMMVSIPFSVVSILYQEASEIVQTFMVHKAISVFVVGVVGGASAMCIAYPQSANFINVAMALLPLACANILAIITPPVLWILAPHSSLPRA